MLTLKSILGNLSEEKMNQVVAKGIRAGHSGSGSGGTNTDSMSDTGTNTGTGTNTNTNT